MRKIWSVIAFLSLIGIAVSVVALVRPSHGILTALHVIPALVFLVLGPLQFHRARSHRWTGRVFVAAALVLGVTALVLSPRGTLGGANETAASMFFGVVFLFDLTRGFIAIRRREIALHREWMIRAYSIGLAVTTVRPIAAVFFATSRLTQLTPREFFGIAFWLGFTLHLIAAEAWIHRTRLQRHSAVDQQFGAHGESRFV